MLKSGCEDRLEMWKSPGLMHYGGILFFNEFSRMLQLRRFLTRRLRYPRRNHHGIRRLKPLEG
jgi:hypothetical protein